MESSSAVRSFYCPLSRPRSSLSETEKHGVVVPMHGRRCSAVRKLEFQGLRVSGYRRNPVVRSSSSSSSGIGATSSNSSSEKTRKDSEEENNNALASATLPAGFKNLLEDLCETEIAELNFKIGGLEARVKRNVGASEAPISVVSPSAPPLEAPPEPEPEPSPEKKSTCPFKNISFGRSRRLDALEASGATGFVVVSSTTVGTFRRGRTVKGKRQPPSCEEGDVVKEGQIVGWVDQLGFDVPVKSDVAGEVLKILFDDNEPVGYGDPIVAVLPQAECPQ